MLILTRLRDGDAIENGISLTEQRMEEIICHDLEVRKVHILSRGLGQFNSDVEFDI